MKKYLTALSLILVLSSCQTSLNSKSSSKEDSAANDPAKTIVSTYSGGQITLKDVNFELEKLVAKNEKLKGLTFDKLSQEQISQEQKEVAIKEVII